MMEKIEDHIEMFYGSNSELQDSMNEYIAKCKDEGWQLVNVICHGGNTYRSPAFALWFQRKVKEEKRDKRRT